MNNGNTDGNIDLNDELLKSSSVYKNVNQEFIVTTTDKVRLVLINTRKNLASNRDWLTPFGIFLSLVTAQCTTTDYKEFLNVPKDYWGAIFVLLTVASGLWLAFTLLKLYQNWGADDVEKIITQMRAPESNSNPPQKS